MFPTPSPLTLQLIKAVGKVNKDDYNHNDVTDVLKAAGYTNLGWLNGGITVSTFKDWTEVYRNDTGSWTIIVSHSTGLYYCVDNGD